MEQRPRVLCVDDEQHMLDALRRNLRRVADVTTTPDPAEALELLRTAAEEAPFAVIVSDMRMPGMTGTALLREAGASSPETVRVLLTGDADIRSAMDAINHGSVFRFLLKPCPPEDLQATIAAAAEQHRLMCAERELLERTLKGCIDALMDTLAMAQPALFTRTVRLRELVEPVCRRLRLSNAWQVEVAAQLGDVGAITLPPEALHALESGTPASDAEIEMLARLPSLADALLARIPRLEAVREIVRHQRPTDSATSRIPLGADAPYGACVLQAVREYDALVWRGMPPNVALAALSVRKVHPPEVLLAIAGIEEEPVVQDDDPVREVDAATLTIGDRLATDVCTSNGLLLVKRGQLITEQLLIRVRNYASTTGLMGEILIVNRDARHDRQRGNAA